jgi:hypothetical protein
MKIILNSGFRIPNSERAIRNSQLATRDSERGMITIVFIALLAIMMILVTADTRALIHLRREVKFLQQQQIKRLIDSQTNSVAVIHTDLK